MDILQGLRFELKCENDEHGRGDDKHENKQNGESNESNESNESIESNECNESNESNENVSSSHVCVGFVETQTRPWFKWCFWAVCLFAWFYFVGYSLYPYINNLGLAYLLYTAGVIAITKLVFKQVTSQALCLGICGPLVLVGVVFGVGFMSSMV